MKSSISILKRTLTEDCVARGWQTEAWWRSTLAGSPGFATPRRKVSSLRMCANLVCIHMCIYVDIKRNKTHPRWCFRRGPPLKQIGCFHSVWLKGIGGVRGGAATQLPTAPLKTALSRFWQWHGAPPIHNSCLVAMTLDAFFFFSALFTKFLCRNKQKKQPNLHFIDCWVKIVVCCPLVSKQFKRCEPYTF